MTASSTAELRPQPTNMQQLLWRLIKGVFGFTAGYDPVAALAVFKNRYPPPSDGIGLAAWQGAGHILHRCADV